MILFTISHSVFGKENPVEILVNSREMALELSYVYIKYVYGKEKAEFQKPYSITDDNNCWKIEGKQPKTLGGNFTILIAKKRWASVACNTHKIIHCTVDSNILPRCVS